MLGMAIGAVLTATPGVVEVSATVTSASPAAPLLPTVVRTVAVSPTSRTPSPSQSWTSMVRIGVVA